MYSLDEYDRKILVALCADSRVSYRDLASQVKLSKDAVHRRVETYLDEGIINGFVTRIAQKPFCEGVVNGMVQTNRLDTCVDFLAEHNRINWVATILGDNDIAFTYFVDSLEQARLEVKREFDEDFIKSFTFNLYTNERKFDRLGVLGGQEASNERNPSKQMGEVSLSSLDRSVLRSLATDSRESYAEIAYDNQVSGPTVSRHVKQLRAQGVIQGFTVSLRPYLFGYDSYFIGVRDTMLSEESVKQIVERDSVTFLTETIGYYDYLFRITVQNQRRLQDEMQVIQELLGYPSLDIHHVLDEHKELFVPPAVI